MSNIFQRWVERIPMVKAKTNLIYAMDERIHRLEEFNESLSQSYRAEIDRLREEIKKLGK